MSTTQQPRFTLDLVKWHPWVATVEDVGPSPEQAALVDEVAPRPTGRPYYALLAHDPPVLRERTALMRAAMYSQGGARRSDRELAAVATSRVNGCVHCASVHARVFAQLTKDESTIQRLLDDGIGTPLAAEERAVVDFAAKLTRDPAGLTTADLAPLRKLGYSDLAIHDIANAAAMFVWANDLFLSLGDAEPTGQRPLAQPA